MPAEWERHVRTWMAFPPANDTFGPEGSVSLLRARQLWTQVARAIARYEPVILLAGADQAVMAQSMAGPHVRVVVTELDDAWLRDSGPTFVDDPASPTGITAVDWIFNGWGGQDWAAWEVDDQVAARVAQQAGHRAVRSRLTNEGGGFHVDGEGTVLLTETVQLDPGRNPGWSKAEVEAELHALLGTTTAIWLPRGLARDYEEYGTRGHVDMVASFLRPGVVAVHTQTDPRHPDYDLSAEIAAMLRNSIDARGRSLEVVELMAPTTTHDEDGRPVDYSYVNHYVANGIVVLGTFDDPHDQLAADVLSRAYPGRVVETVDARGVFANGGGIHCITQQEPQGVRDGTDHR
jgi:agmatine deiminase